MKQITEKMNNHSWNLFQFHSDQGVFLLHLNIQIEMQYEMQYY